PASEKTHAFKPLWSCAPMQVSSTTSKSLRTAGLGANLGAITAADSGFWRAAANGHSNARAFCISERLSTNPCGHHLGSLCIVRPSASRPAEECSDAQFAFNLEFSSAPRRAKMQGFASGLLHPLLH